MWDETTLTAKEWARQALQINSATFHNLIEVNEADNRPYEAGR
jgi:hypothetical protein